MLNCSNCSSLTKASTKSQANICTKEKKKTEGIKCSSIMPAAKGINTIKNINDTQASPTSISLRIYRLIPQISKWQHDLFLKSFLSIPKFLMIQTTFIRSIKIHIKKNGWKVKSILIISERKMLQFVLRF